MCDTSQSSSFSSLSLTTPTPFYIFPSSSRCIINNIHPTVVVRFKVQNRNLFYLFHSFPENNFPSVPPRSPREGLKRSPWLVFQNGCVGKELGYEWHDFCLNDDSFVTLVTRSCHSEPEQIRVRDMNNLQVDIHASGCARETLRRKRGVLSACTL